MSKYIFSESLWPEEYIGRGFNTIWAILKFDPCKNVGFLFLAVKKLAHTGNLGTFNMLFPKIYLQDPEIFSFVLFISGLKPKIPGL